MAFANRPVRSQSQWKASIFLCRHGLVSMLGEVGNTQLAFSNNKYEIGHSRGKKVAGMLKSSLTGFYISPWAALPCRGWHGDWKRKLSTSLSLATVSTYFTANPLLTVFSKLKMSLIPFVFQSQDAS